MSIQTSIRYQPDVHVFTLGQLPYDLACALNPDLEDAPTDDVAMEEYRQALMASEMGEFLTERSIEHTICSVLEPMGLSFCLLIYGKRNAIAFQTRFGLGTVETYDFEDQEADAAAKKADNEAA